MQHTTPWRRVTCLGLCLGLSACVASPSGKGKGPTLAGATGSLGAPAPSAAPSAPAKPGEVPTPKPLVSPPSSPGLSLPALASTSPGDRLEGIFTLNAQGQLLSNHGGGVVSNHGAGLLNTALSGALAAFQQEPGQLQDSAAEIISGDGGADFYRLAALADRLATVSRGLPDLSRATHEVSFPDGTASRAWMLRHAPVPIAITDGQQRQAQVEGSLHQLVALRWTPQGYQGQLVESMWSHEGSPLGATGLHLVDAQAKPLLSRSYPLRPALQAEPSSLAGLSLVLEGPMPAKTYGLLFSAGQPTFQLAGKDGRLATALPDPSATPIQRVMIRAFLPADTPASSAVLRHAYHFGRTGI